MLSRFTLLFFCLLSLSFELQAQNSENNSLTLENAIDSIGELMYRYYGNERFDSAIIYAKEKDSLTLIRYDTSKEYAESTNDVGVIYHKNFDYPNAEKYFKKAISILEKSTSENVADYATFTNNLAALYDDLGFYSLADSLYRNSALIRKTIFADAGDAYAESLNNLGNLYRKIEDYDSAKIYLEQSLLIRSKVKDFSYAQTLNTLALVTQKTGNFSSAETKYKEARAVIDSCCKGKQLNEYWDITNNLASLYFDMSNYKAAEIIHKQVLDHLLDKFHKKITDYATTLGLLAKDYNAAGEYDSALYFLKEASGILLKELSGNHPAYATNLNVIASTYEKKGLLDSAKEYYNKVLEIRKKIFGTNVPIYAETLNSLGSLSAEKKDYGKAENYFKESAKIRLAAWGKNHLAYAESESNLLGLYYSSHQYNQWADLLDPTIDVWKNSTMHLLLSFGEKEKQTYLDNHLSQRDLFLSMLWYFNRYQNTESLHASYFKMVTALQGWLLSGSQELNSVISQKKDTSLLILYNKWLSAKEYFARLIQFTPEQQKNMHINVDSLIVVAGDLEKSIIEKLPELQNSLSNTSVSPSKIATALKRNEILINWVSFRYKNPERWTDSVLYAAFIISARDSTAKFIGAFEQNQLKNLLTNYFNYSGRGAIVKPMQTNKSVGLDLYKLIWQPILPYIKKADKVFIIPSGLLNKISFQSMEDPMHKTLLETIEVHLLNSVNELNNVNSKLTSKTISLFGGASFDSTSGGEAIHSDKERVWNYLKGSADEVKELTVMFKKNNWVANIYLGLAANEENLKALSGNNSPEILHVATHGFYNPPYETIRQNLINKDNNSDFPLLRSGFLLSGANVYWYHNTSLTNDDGIVRAQEISNLNFSNTKLLTLSACQTALGDINTNEGVYGLQRAFKIAGVKEMLITLWNIPDKETKELMNIFYSQVLKGDSYYQALHKAQLIIKEKYPNPAIWAGFELIGE